MSKAYVELQAIAEAATALRTKCASSGRPDYVLPPEAMHALSEARAWLEKACVVIERDGKTLAAILEQS